MRARIIKIVSNQYTVLDENHNIIECVAMGKLRKDEIIPVVGDFVEIEKLDGQVGIQKIHERSNQMIRPAIANVDQILIVMSAKEPDFSSQLVDRILFLVGNAGIKPVLVVTKMDLLNDDSPVHQEVSDYIQSGYDVITCSKDDVKEKLMNTLADKITVLTGQSGVGKSTLLNQFDANFNIITQEISKALGRGKHTTRHSELHPVAQGWVADTPGFSSLDFAHMSLEDLKQSVFDFKPYQDGCFFRDCLHLKEPKCAVRKAIEDQKCSRVRYEHYLEIVQVIKNRKERY